jgi:hypothetical protein
LESIQLSINFEVTENCFELYTVNLIVISRFQSIYVELKNICVSLKIQPIAFQ